MKAQSLMPIVVSIVVSSSGICFSKTPESIWHKDSFGYVVASQYNDLMKDCGIPQAASPIPAVFKKKDTPLPLDEAAIPIFSGNSSLSGVFGHVFEARDYQLLRQRNTSAAEIELPKLLLPDLAQGRNGATVLLRSDTCNSAVGAQVDVGIHYGAGQLESTVKANTKQRRLMTFLVGSFVSPIIGKLDGPRSTSADRLEARIRIWDFLSSRSDLRKKKLYVIKTFEGAILYSSLLASSSVEASANSNVAVTYFATMSSSFNADWKKESTTNWQDHQVYFHRAPPPDGDRTKNWTDIIDFDELPSAHSIASWVKNNYHADPEPDGPLVTNKAYVHNIYIRGIPEDRCNDKNNFISIAANPVRVKYGNGSVVIVRNRPIIVAAHGDDAGNCKLSMTYRPVKEEFYPEAPKTVDYSIQYGQEIEHESIMFAISFQVPKKQDLFAEQIQDYSATATAGQIATWDAPVSIVDTQARIKVIAMSYVDSTCAWAGDKNLLVPTAAFKPVAGGRHNAGTVSLIWRPFLDTSRTLAPSKRICSTRLTVTFECEDESYSAPELTLLMQDVDVSAPPAPPPVGEPTPGPAPVLRVSVGTSK